MKNKILSHLFMFIIGGLIFGSIAVYASTKAGANEIEYTPKDSTWNVSSVNEALNSLYESAGDSNPTFGTPFFNQSQGDLLPNRTTSLKLDRGKYLVVAIFNQGTVRPNNSVSNHADSQIPMTCEKDCEKEFLYGKAYQSTASAKAYSIYYLRGIINMSMYYVKINSESDTLTITFNEDTNNNQVGQAVILQAIPIS